MHFENLRVGQWITIVEGPTYRHADGYGELQSSEDERLNGLPLRIRALNAPFIVVEPAAQWENDAFGAVRPSVPKPFPIDCRRVKLTRVSQAYVRALEPRSPRPPRGRKESNHAAPDPAAHRPFTPGGLWRPQ